MKISSQSSGKYFAAVVLATLLSTTAASESYAWERCGAIKGDKCTARQYLDEVQYKCRLGQKGNKCLKCERTELPSGESEYKWTGPAKACDTSKPIIPKTDPTKDKTMFEADETMFDADE